MNKEQIEQIEKPNPIMKIVTDDCKTSPIDIERTDNNTPIEYDCNICDSKYTTKSGLKYHT